MDGADGCLGRNGIWGVDWRWNWRGFGLCSGGVERNAVFVVVFEIEGLVGRDPLGF